MKNKVKSDREILEFIIFAVLPDSLKGEWTSFEKIMICPPFIHWKIIESDVFRILKTSLLIEKEYDEGGFWRFGIDHNYFLSPEERASENSDYLLSKYSKFCAELKSK